MKLLDTMKKQGGMQLLKRYWRSGAFFTSIGQVILLGKSKTALEILRLSATLKTKQKLEKKYRKHLREFDANWKDIEHVHSNKVWICWFQGMDTAPHLVQECYQSIKENLADREVVLITSENMSEYAEFPDYILDKWKKGQITHTHMTDLLRLELLTKHGGVWIDATVFCSGGTIPEYMLDSELFFFQTLKPGRDGNASYISSWFMSACTNSKVLLATKYLCYEYWKKNTDLMDYFLLHDFMSIVLDYYPDEWNKVMPRDNSAPHILLLRLFEEFDENTWSAIKELTPFHKLTYKFEESDTKKENTYYQYLFNK